MMVQGGRLRLWVAAGSSLAFLAAAFLWFFQKPPLPEASSPSSRFARIGVLEVRDKPLAPDFTLAELMSGKPISMEDLRGKVIFLNFWATWCLPCQWEMPEMEKLYQAYREKGLVVLAVSLDQGGPRVPRDFMKQKSLTYPAVVDEGFRVAQSYGVRGLPASFFIDRKGRVVGVAHGPREWFGKEAKEFIEGLLDGG